MVPDAATVLLCSFYLPDADWQVAFDKAGLRIFKQLCLALLEMPLDLCERALLSMPFMSSSSDLTLVPMDASAARDQLKEKVEVFYTLGYEYIEWVLLLHPALRFSRLPWLQLIAFRSQRLHDQRGARRGGAFILNSFSSNSL